MLTWTRTVPVCGLFGLLAACGGGGGGGDEAPANQAPTMQALSKSVAKNAVLSVTLEAADPEGDAVVFAITDGPQRGEASVSEATLIYIPNEGYVGEDVITVTASDGVKTSAAVAITIEVTANGTVVLGTEDLAGITSIDSQGTITVSDTSTAGWSQTVGGDYVVVNSTNYRPSGMIAKVTAVNADGTIETIPAALDEVFEELDLVADALSTPEPLSFVVRDEPGAIDITLVQPAQSLKPALQEKGPSQIR